MIYSLVCDVISYTRDCRGRDRIVVGFTTTSYAISVYPTNVMSSNPAQARCTRTTLCDKVCQWLAASRWFSPGTPVSSTNKTDRHDITEILLKVAFNTITLYYIYIYIIHIDGGICKITLPVYCILFYIQNLVKLTKDILIRMCLTKLQTMYDPYVNRLSVQHIFMSKKLRR